MISSDNRYNQFKEYLSGSHKIVVIPHKDPDGDAIGAALGWYNVLTGNGYEVSVISPNDLPVGFDWMQGFKDILNFETSHELASDKILSSDLLIFLDFNSISRVAGMQKLLMEINKPRVVIDHHPYPEEGIGNILFSETDSSSTCELSYKVISGLGLGIDLNAAECLYAGIMTDTGILSYNSSRPETYHIVADIISKGIDKEKIHKEVFHSNSFDRMLLLGHALCNRLERIPGLPVAFIALSQDDLIRFNYQPGDTEGLVNYPLSIDGIDVSALFIEKGDNFVKASFRSRGKVAINKFAEIYFNGGGHQNAAGGESGTSLTESLDLFKSAIREYMHQNG